MTDALNHSRRWSLTSSAMRSARPVFSATAEREVEKLSSSAIRSTFSRVAFETSSGRVKERDTVEIDTLAARATS